VGMASGLGARLGGAERGQPLGHPLLQRRLQPAPTLAM